MADIHGKVTTSQNIGGRVSASSAVNGDIDKDVKDRLYRDYNLLHNKPSIEGVELKGNKKLEDFGIPYVFYGTREQFDSDPTLITIEKAIYVYWDYQKDSEGNDIPGIKVGDGKGYLIDAPFADSLYYSHIRDMVIHVTQEDRDRWDEKVRCYMDPVTPENLVFTTSSSKGE